MTIARIICWSLMVSVASVRFSAAIWPPAYEINLTQSEYFVISDELSDEDVADVYQEEEEMIKKEQLEAIGSNKLRKEEEEERLYGFHRSARKRNEDVDNRNGNAGAVVAEKRSKIIIESNFEKEEPKPFTAGFVDPKGNYIKSIGGEGKPAGLTPIAAKSAEFAKREEEILGEINITKVAVDKNYDYSAMKRDYDDSLKREERSNNTLNYTEVKEDDTLKDTLQNMVDVEMPKNCSAEEAKGIGLAAARCFLSEIKKPHTKGKNLQIFEKILRIIIIWLVVYLFIAIPCWCQRGWCCCCFRCRVCRPHRRIDEAKKFLMDNPAGVYHDENGEKLTYTPTIYENYMQKRLEEAIMKL